MDGAGRASPRTQRSRIPGKPADQNLERWRQNRVEEKWSAEARSFRNDSAVCGQGVAVGSRRRSARRGGRWQDGPGRSEAMRSGKGESAGTAGDQSASSLGAARPC